MGAVKKMDTGLYLALDPQTIQGIISATNREIEKIKDLVAVPIVLTSPIVRIYFKKLVDQFYPNTVVLSFNEIDPDIKIQALGNITWNKKGGQEPLCQQHNRQISLLQRKRSGLVREYKRNGSQELRNQLVMHYSYIAKGVVNRMGSTSINTPQRRR